MIYIAVFLNQFGSNLPAAKSLSPLLTQFLKDSEQNRKTYFQCFVTAKFPFQAKDGLLDWDLLTVQATAVQCFYCSALVSPCEMTEYMSIGVV